MLSIHLNVLFCHDFIILLLIKLWLLLQFWIKIINFTIRHVDNTSMISDYRTKWQQKQNDPTAWWLTGLGALVCLLQMLWKGVKHDDKHYECSSSSAGFPDSVWFMSMFAVRACTENLSAANQCINMKWTEHSLHAVISLAIYIYIQFWTEWICVYFSCFA